VEHCIRILIWQGSATFQVVLDLKRVFAEGPLYLLVSLTSLTILSISGSATLDASAMHKKRHMYLVTAKES
jgi:hypothetical protein